MSQLATKLQPQSDWHSGLSNQIQILIDAEAFPRYEYWLHRLQSDVPEVWEPWEHIQILHGKSPKAVNFFSIERSYDHAFKGKTFAEVESWKAQDPQRRSSLTKDNNWRSRSWQVSRLQGDDDFTFMSHCAEMEREKDVFVSMSQFGNPSYYGPQMRQLAKEKAAGVPKDQRTRVKRFARSSPNAMHTSAVWVDIDNLANHGLSETEMAAFFLAYCEEEQIQLPSYIMFSGRGLHCVWLLNKHHTVDRRKGSIRKWWEKVMEELHNRLEIFQPDTKVIDLARVLRLAGTINSKSGEVVRPLFVNKHDHGLVRYIFKDLADSLLMDRETYLAIAQQKYEHQGKAWARQNAERSARKAELDEKYKDDNKSVLGIRSRHTNIIKDLDKLHAGRWNKGYIQDGLQDIWLFHRACSHAQIDPQNKVEEKITNLGRVIGLGARTAQKNMKTLLKRAQEQILVNQAIADGKDPSSLKLEFYNPSYQFVAYTPGVKKIIKDLGITEREMRDFDLRILITDNLRAERKRTRMAEKRGQAKAPQSRMEIKQDAVRRAQQVSEAMTENGWTIREAAEALSMSKSAVSRLLKHKTGFVPPCSC